VVSDGTLAISQNLADTGGGEQIYEVPLLQYATPLSKRDCREHAVELQGAPTTGDYIELAWLDQHYNYRFAPGIR